jgi:hypothetical protein
MPDTDHRASKTAPPAKLPAVSYERIPGAASRPLTLPAVLSYRRREPEKTALYAIVRDNLESFLEDGRRASPNGTGYPPFIENEFRRYLSCGQLSRGFARVQCSACGHESLLAFSCKGRLCPSCQARRAADTAADLVDRVLPVARYRQFVLTFPWEIRYPLAMSRGFFSKMLTGFLRKLFAWQRLRGRRLGLRGGQTGSVTFVHRFSGALSLFPHVHALVPDGLFVPQADADLDSESELKFVPLPPPSDDDILTLTVRIVKHLTAIARQHLGEDGYGPDSDATDSDEILVRSCVTEAMRNPAEPASRPSQRLLPTSPKPLTARLAGFSLHAARAIEPSDRSGLERLCRYGLRAPFATERFSPVRLENGERRVRYQLPKPLGPYRRTELLFEPVALLRRLAAILPAPRTHLVRYHGVLANRSKFRSRLPRPPAADSAHACSVPDIQETAATPEPCETLDGSGLPRRPPRRRLPWAELLLRVLDVDALTCPSCSTPMLVLAFITDPTVLRRILAHLNLPTSPPRVAPAREPRDPALHEYPEDQDFVPDIPADDWDQIPRRPGDRAPPDDE